VVPLFVTLAMVMLMSHARAEAQYKTLRTQRSNWTVRSDDGWDEAALLRLLQDDEEVAVADQSRSHGSAHAGTLAGAVRLPSHIGYAVREPSRAWGTSRAIDWLVEAFDFVVSTDPGAPRVRVHDLSLRYGGPMRGHKSHQSGRDVDITYYQRSCQAECIGRPVSASELDAGRQWRLLRYWLEHGQAEFIFVDYALQRPLYEQAKSAGATPRQLADWFQYPRGPDFRAGVIRHVPNHANHVHVRFRCAAQDRACTETATRRVPARDATAAPFLFELVDDESEDKEILEQLGD
jgi:murein endopeptidase